MINNDNVDWDSSVGIATSYGLDGPEVESQTTPEAEVSKAMACGRSLAGVEDSKPAEGMDVYGVC
jgi:hypothetical protein